MTFGLRFFLKFLTDFAYDKVAHRYQIFGRAESRIPPNVSDRDRFLDL
jgi:predicted DCC family thiol-disulfide oxidoreductase YuxK